MVITFKNTGTAACTLHGWPHVAFTRAGGVDLGHLNPVRPSPESVAVLAAHARELADACGRPVLLENIASRGKPVSDIEQGYISASSCILANLSMKTGRTLTWDAEKQRYQMKDFGGGRSPMRLKAAQKMESRPTICVAHPRVS